MNKELADIQYLVKLEDLDFSDTEKRIFLAAMSRELRICEDVDKEIPDGICLSNICRKIQSKVKKVLF